MKVRGVHAMWVPAMWGVEIHQETKIRYFQMGGGKGLPVGIRLLSPGKVVSSKNVFGGTVKCGIKIAVSGCLVRPKVVTLRAIVRICRMERFPRSRVL